MTKTKNIIITHKNCMDGLASAYVTQKHLGEAEVLFIQYGGEQEIFEYFKNNQNNKYLVYFTDFSLKKDKMLELIELTNVDKITVFDHHKTAEAELCDLNNKNIFVYFNMNKSGVGVCVNNFIDFPSNPTLKPHELDIMKYIEDRDLWKWELPNSKEVNEGLRFLVKSNDIGSLETVLDNYEVKELQDIGSTILDVNEQYIKSKLKHVTNISINCINFKLINSTHLISELGNRICDEHQTPAMLYFISENNEVVFSLRSLDNLPDVSVVANSFGGGGHRNACGFTLNLEDGFNLLSKGTK